MLRPSVVERALDRAVAALHAYDRGGSRAAQRAALRAALDARLAAVTCELANLAEMAARGGTVELDALTRDTSVVALFQPHAVRRELGAMLEEWQRLAAGEPDEARGVLSTVLRERIAFQPEDLYGVESFKLTMPIAFERVMRAIIPASNWNGVPDALQLEQDRTVTRDRRLTPGGLSACRSLDEAVQ